MTRLIAILLATVVVLSAAGTVVADTEGRPVISVHLPDNRVEVGAETTLDLLVLNGGEIELGGSRDDESRVTTARRLRLSVDAGDAPLRVETSTQPVGSVPEGVAGPVTFAVTVNESAPPGTYSLPVTISYVYTREIETSGTDLEHFQESVTMHRSVAVVVERRAHFDIDAASADLAVGESGPVELAIRNTGEERAAAASVVVQSDDPALTFAGGQRASVFVGDWAPGAVRNLTVTAAIAKGADARSYPLSVTVNYRDADGDSRQSTADTTGIVPRVEQTFEIDDISSTYAVGEEGTLRGSVANTGPSPVRNAVVVFAAENENIVPVETEYAVGDLGPGESATFAFDADIADSADAGPRQLSFEVRYRDVSDDVRRSDPLDARVEVGPRKDVFEVEPVSATLSAGTAGVIELRVTNAGDEAVTDVSAKLFTDDPLSSSDDEAFIDRLEPGTSTVVRFALTAGADALEKVYPVSLDFQYDDAEGDTRLSDTYDVPVDVTAPEDTGGPSLTTIGLGVVAVLVVIGGLWLWRRR